MARGWCVLLVLLLWPAVATAQVAIKAYELPEGGG